MYICIYMYMYMCLRACMYVCVYSSCTYVCMHVCNVMSCYVMSCMYACMYVRLHAGMVTLAVFLRAWCDDCGIVLLLMMMIYCADCSREAEYGQGMAVNMIVVKVPPLVMIVKMLLTSSNHLQC